MSAKSSILVVDDDASLRRVLEALLTQDGHAARSVASGAEALEVLASELVDLVISDLRMPGMDGMTLLAAIAERFPDVPVVMLTAHGSVPIAVSAMRKGAADFLLKPFDREEILFVVRKVLETARRETPETLHAAHGMIGGSRALLDALEIVRRAAAGNATVLIRGESGTGKELAARALHDGSPRRAGPFVKVHCAALPDTLLESELFGYEKGAFTGAVTRKPGRVELAEGGTLFLDEIGEIPMTTQVKLLRVLQDREIERLGGTQTLKVDVRFVAATHRDLEAMVASRALREDLFYRLNVVPVWMPPLRDRPDDIERLAHAFCETAGRANGRASATLTPGAIDLLVRSPWRGNVRELQNFVERLVVLAPNDAIDVADVQRERAREPLSKPVEPSSSVERGSSLGALEARRREGEREEIMLALGRAGDNRALAARLLGISRRTLYNKLHEHDLLA